MAPPSITFIEFALQAEVRLPDELLYVDDTLSTDALQASPASTPRMLEGHRCEHPMRLRQVETIQIHHLVPRVHEVAHECLLCIVTSVEVRDGSELGV